MRKNLIKIILTTLAITIIITSIALAVLPTQDNPKLMASSVGNTTDDFLTVYNKSTFDSNGAPVTNIITWFVNGYPIQELYMPFEKIEGTDTMNVKDYSQLENHGWDEFISWHPSIGINGTGAYEFTGSPSQQVYVDHVLEYDETDEFTLMAWVKPKDNLRGWQSVIDKFQTNSGYRLVVHYNHFQFMLRNSSNHFQVSWHPYTTLNEWYHLAGRFNGTHSSLFVNGVEVDSDPFKLNNIGTNFTPFRIGYSTNNLVPFNGTLDEIKVFSRALSSEQIAIIASGDVNTISPKETKKGERWTACITPNNGEFDGNEKCTNKIKIRKNSKFCGRPLSDFDSIITGTNGNDNLVGTNFDDLIRGRKGNDNLSGGHGNDCLIGGNGDDYLFGGNGEDILYGNKGNDILKGSHNNDTINGGPGIDIIYGGNGDDILKGGSGDDFVYGEHNNDKIYGNKGQDTLVGGNGDDKIRGNKGNDTLIGNHGIDSCIGGSGFDIIDSTCES